MGNIKKQLAGKRSKAAGEAFEKLLTAACEHYRAENRACIEKTPEPMRPISPYGDRRQGRYIACFVKTAQPDFKGILRDGTGIMFEAKHTDTDRIRQEVITETQWKNLDSYERFGAKCYVMVSVELKDFYRVPWSIWKKMKEQFGHRYMNKEELQPYRIVMGKGILDFLKEAEEHEEYNSGSE